MFEESVTDEREFHAALQALLTAADANGVDVRGAWPVVGGHDSESGFDVEIVGLHPTVARRLREAEVTANDD